MGYRKHKRIEKAKDKMVPIVPVEYREVLKIMAQAGEKDEDEEEKMKPLKSALGTQV